MSFLNPFVGSQIEVTKTLKEGIDDISELSGEIEDENERFILYDSGVLVRKIKSEKKYFPDNTNLSK